MKWMSRRIKIKKGVSVDGYSFAGFTGTTSYVGDNGVWWICLDQEVIDDMNVDYKQTCIDCEESYEDICLRKQDFDFID